MGSAYLGMVRYSDFATEPLQSYGSMIELATTKRKSFEYEREVRLIAFPDPDEGVKHFV